MTRIAGGDPGLWQQIVTGDAPAVAGLLTQVRDQLDVLIDAVTAGDRGPLAEILERGVAGTRAIPSEHGGPAADRLGPVSLPDHPASSRGFRGRRRRAAGTSTFPASRPRPPPRTGLVQLPRRPARPDHLPASLGTGG